MSLVSILVVLFCLVDKLDFARAWIGISLLHSNLILCTINARANKKILLPGGV
jgi:hypothetical protein